MWILYGDDATVILAKAVCLNLSETCLIREVTLEKNSPKTPKSNYEHVVF